MTNLIVVLDADFGKGVFARHEILRNTVLGEYRGQKIDEQEKNRRLFDPQNLGRYIFQCGSFFVDGLVCGNWTRYVNHTCKNSNVVVFEVSDRLMMLSKEHILAGTEILMNYGRSYWYNRQEKCQCKKL